MGYNGKMLPLYPQLKEESMEKILFKGMFLTKGQNNSGELTRENLVIGVKFKSDFTGKDFYWYPSYKHLKFILHNLAALHGKKEVTTRVIDDTFLIGIYNEQIEKKLQSEEEDIVQVPSCEE
jgi:hypothetical protein